MSRAAGGPAAGGAAARSLVVLGGADGAITTIKTARRLGLRTICVDQLAEAPAVALADEHLHVSTRDGQRLIEALSHRDDLAGVVSPASDVNLPSQFLLAGRLGLPSGLSESALRASLNKGFFREVCDKLGQPGPRFVQGDPAQVRAEAAGLTFPLIVKPTDASGGRGIRHCHHPDQLPHAVAHAAAASASAVVIAEEFLLGDHYTAEAIVQDGRIALFGLGRRELTPPPHFVTMEHTMPGAPAGLTREVRRMLEAASQAMAYRWGSLNADVLVTADGRVVLVELGARLGGNGSAELLGLISGGDVTETYIRMAIGERVWLPAPAGPTGPTPVFAAFRVLRAGRSGRLVAIRGVTAARQLPDVVDLVVSAAPGDPVEPYHRAGAKVGYVLVASPDRHRLRATLAQLESLLRVEVAAPRPGGEAGGPATVRSTGG